MRPSAENQYEFVKMENSVKKFAIPIISLFLLVLATGLHAENVDQPRWDTTLLWHMGLGDGTHHGFGGALGYSFNFPVELEGEFYLMSAEAALLYGVSGALLFNFEILNNTYYILGGVSTLGAFTGRVGADMFLMLGGGMKLAIQKEKNYRVRFDFRLHPAEDGWMRVSIGLMWLFR